MSDIPLITSTPAFARLSASHADASIWPDHEHTEGGYAYYWAVTKSSGTTRILSYFRCKGGICELRTYDADGDDLWVTPEA